MKTAPNLFVYDADGYGGLVPVLPFPDFHRHRVKIDGDIVLHWEIPVLIPDALQFSDDIVYLSVRQSHDSSFPHVYTCMHVCSQYEPAPVPMGMALRTRRMNAMGAMRTGKPALRPFCSQKPLWHGLPAWFISSSVGDRPFRQARRSGNTACRRSGICSSGTERQAYGSGR